MKIFSIIRPSSFCPKRPQEDYLFFSKKYPIFVVADGVTLLIKKGKKYPKQSGAGTAAEIFCKKAISTAEKKYKNFKLKDLKQIFRSANKAVADYNKSCGRTKETIDYTYFDFFSATTAFLLIKGKKAYWWSLCDSGVFFLDKAGKKIFISDSHSPVNGKFLPKNWVKMNPKKRAKVMHSFRNKVGKNKEFLGYGVADGQELAEEYLQSGFFDFSGNKVAMVYTDGFEHYLELNEFKKLFSMWPDDLEKKLDALTKRKIKQSKKKYGTEKSLIAISSI